MKRNILLVAAMPTPNGRLHLGHIGGQFLILDILKRFYARRGDNVLYFCGLDVYDNAISVSAYQENKTEAETCQYYSNGIAADLTTMGISCDYFVNWLDPNWENVFQKELFDINAKLLPLKIEKSEKIPFIAGTNKPHLGRWLVGYCPKCSNEMTGATCNFCCVGFSPSDIVQPKSIQNHSLLWREMKNQFINLPRQKLLQYINSIEAKEIYKETIRKALSNSPEEVRWTSCDSWGIPAGSDGNVYCNTTFSLVEQRVFGEIFKKKFNLRKNAFEENSGVYKIIAYGKDCLEVLMQEIPGLGLGTGNYEGYQRHIVSEYLMLNGQKMSTNKKYGIWVAELKEHNITSDAARYFLCSLFKSNGVLDINKDALKEIQHRYDQEILIPVQDAIAAVRKSGTDKKISNDEENPIAHKVTKLIQKQAQLLNSHVNQLGAAIDFINQWISDYPPAQRNIQWLLGLAVIAEPFLPNLALHIGEALGININESYEKLISTENLVG